MYKSAWQE